MFSFQTIMLGKWGLAVHTVGHFGWITPWKLAAQFFPLNLIYPFLHQQIYCLSLWTISYLFLTLQEKRRILNLEPRNVTHFGLVYRHNRLLLKYILLTLLLDFHVFLPKISVSNSISSYHIAVWIRLKQPTKKGALGENHFISKCHLGDVRRGL